MDQPIGFVFKEQKRKVHHLKISIYGLKQLSKQWNLKFHEVITSSGLTIVKKDHYVYVKQMKVGISFLSLHVDDILLVGNNMEMINTTKRWLFSNFNMKDMS